MKVLDLSCIENFEAECVRLRKRLEELVSPDLIVGIATGGEYVVRGMGYAPDQKLMFVKRERGTTKLKRKIKLGFLLKRSPTFLNNYVRKLEVLFRELLFNFAGRKLEKGSVSPLSEAYGGIRSVLLVDDAVDSGATFADVFDYVRNQFPDAEVFTAALSQTFINPAFKVDFVLHRRTLVRGPWAMDVKSAKEPLKRDSGGCRS